MGGLSFSLCVVANASASVVASACGESAAMLNACGVPDACACCCAMFALSRC